MLTGIELYVKAAAKDRESAKRDRKDQRRNRWVIVILTIVIAVATVGSWFRNQTTVVNNMPMPQEIPVVPISPQPIPLSPNISFNPTIYVVASRPGAPPNKIPVWESSNGSEYDPRDNAEFFNDCKHPQQTGGSYASANHWKSHSK
jgi:hypothetical protein